VLSSAAPRVSPWLTPSTAHSTPAFSKNTLCSIAFSVLRRLAATWCTAQGVLPG